MGWDGTGWEGVGRDRAGRDGMEDGVRRDEGWEGMEVGVG